MALFHRQASLRSYRAFSTVTYAKEIVFSPTDKAHKAIDVITQIHKGVEQNRGSAIPDWAYRDVLFMLIHYSIASYELLEHHLTDIEKNEVYNVFYRVGVRMNLKDLPPTYQDWLPVRKEHLDNNLQKSNYSIDLFKQYKKHLGVVRFKILVEGQKLVVPRRVKELLHFNNFSLLAPLVPVYKLSRLIKMDGLLKKYYCQLNTGSELTVLI
ncbi:oxygenase MpaB family protein [Niabella ginsengisoli]|uniref:Oxygenase MpaB family protein n=1 Tax=Niabella ginsengisoli TaxID=522298 RepID=A0ABS9SJR8_9BACT|nr:oxygenase MpaB family protein [Niabella ginsengisoli]MCH5598614.1 oxygenase MpaB family protein [Niabella ginsengisoli]